MNVSSNEKTDREINLEYCISNFPVIDTHEHFYDYVEDENDPIRFILGNYYLQTDYMIAAGVKNFDIERLMDTKREFHIRYQEFMEWTQTVSCTGYYRAAIRTIERICDVEVKNGLTIEIMSCLRHYLEKRTLDSCISILKEAKIKRIITNPDIREFKNGKVISSFSMCSPAFPLPPFHCFRSFDELMALPCVETEKDISDLDSYLDAFERYFKICLRNGCVCIKDQSAYMRKINFGKPCKEAAQKAYESVLKNRDYKLSQEEWIPLSDWLMHGFMKIAGCYDVTVQLHTGHLAFPYSDIRESNAISLTELIQSHPNVRFVLFHGNWPNMSEMLFLLKNYPNVYLDLCWVQSIDPVYSTELMKHAAVTVPWNKVCGFGGDTSVPEWSIGYVEQAKENIVRVLKELIAEDYITYEQACKLASAWLYENPEKLYRWSDGKG